MTSSKDLLQKVWGTYEVTRNSLAVVDEALEKGDPSFFQNTDFPILPQGQTKEVIKECHAELADLVTISFWAAFERFVIDYVQQKGVNLDNVKPKDLADPLRKKFELSVEYWRFDEVLDLFKPLVGSILVGDVKNIKKYRDFIAHKNPRRKQPAKWDPERTYDRLTEFVQKL